VLLVRNVLLYILKKNNNEIVIGGKEEGYTKFTKEQFVLFIKEIKKGIFDEYI